MNDSLIERVRERLAAESAPLRPTVVAAAIRAESGGVLGDTEVLDNLRVLETELTGAGVLEPLLRAEGTTDVLVTAPDAVWVDDGAGLRRTALRFTDEAAVRRLASGWRSPPAAASTTPSRGWTVNSAGRLRTVHRPAARGAAARRRRRHLPVAAGPAAGHPGPRGAGGRRCDHPEAARLLADVITARLAFLVSGEPARARPPCCRRPWVRSHRTSASSASGRPELAPPHPHLVRLVARTANVEGVGEITGASTGPAGTANAAGPDRRR